MKAAIFHGPGRDLSIEDIDIPTLEAGEVLIRVSACGVCATDLHYIHGTPTFKKPPLVLGHEISGTVESAAPDVQGYAVGDRVLVPPVLSCGVCINCREGRDNICEQMRMVGSHVDGGFAQFVKAPARALFKLPADIPLQEAAVISDAISTAFHAVKNRGEVRPGEWVAVFGCGGVGINVVQIASALGALVIAVDIDPRKLGLAKELGALFAFNPQDVDVVKTIRGLTEGKGVDVAFEVIGKPPVMQQAFEAVRAGGRVVIVGYSAEDWGLKVNRLMFREMAVVGSLGCRSVEYPAIMRMIRKGSIKLQQIVSDKMPLERINEALKRLEEGVALGRQLIVF